MYLEAMVFRAEIMDASGVSLKWPQQCMSQSRMNSVRSMLHRALAISGIQAVNIKVICQW